MPKATNGHNARNTAIAIGVSHASILSAGRRRGLRSKPNRRESFTHFVVVAIMATPLVPRCTLAVWPRLRFSPLAEALRHTWAWSVPVVRVRYVRPHGQLDDTGGLRKRRLSVLRRI